MFGKIDFQVEPLGDRAILLTCHSTSDAQALAQALQKLSPAGMENMVVAYHSVAVHINRHYTSIVRIISDIKNLQPAPLASLSKVHYIPCCYEIGEDLETVASKLHLTRNQVIDLHCKSTFTIYAIGFSPGFPYMGWLPEELQGIPRRKEPRLKVPAGSVAIAGKQTAIYPQSTPGGWALIGRTPKVLVDIHAGYFPLSVGDQVIFQPISAREFQTIIGSLETSQIRQVTTLQA
ncbi:MAG TPA: allophanate hydrolase subunit 1 [Gemmatales bacterium]|nr:allophanate hydrolase subunit 1 [Gemmatales bacterium]